MSVVKESNSSSVRIISPSMTVKSRPINDLVQDRVLPRQVGTGAMRGTQLVGNTGTMIDSANNRIVLTNSDGATVGIGTIPGSTTSEFGFFATNEDGDLIMKIVNGTWYVYDPENDNENRMQTGKLPDGTYNLAITKEGYDVADAIT